MKPDFQSLVGFGEVCGRGDRQLSATAAVDRQLFAADGVDRLEGGASRSPAAGHLDVVVLTALATRVVTGI